MTTESFTYKCSPYECKTGQCKLEKCPAGYQGNLIPPGVIVNPEDCTENICDGNKDYIEFCGKQADCPKGPEYTNSNSDSDSCYKYTCPDGGTLDLQNKTCKKLKCPKNTHEVSDGTCRRN